MSDQPPFQPYPEDSARRESEAYNTPTEQPPSIKTAVLLMRIGAALSALYLLLTLVTLSTLKDDIRDELEAQDTTFTQSDLDTTYNIALATVIFLGLVGVALWLWMASANGKGKKWARIVATVLAGLNILFSALSLIGAGTGSSTPLAVLYTLANLAIAIGALIFMYRSDASRYYAAMSPRR